MQQGTFNWSLFLLGILYILIAILSFNMPGANLLALVIIFAVRAFLKGAFEIFIRNRWQNITGQKGTATLVLGVLDIIIGIFFLFNLHAGLTILPYIFAAWFILDSIHTLMIGDIYRLASDGFYWLKLIMSILGFILGIILLFVPITSALTLAFLIGFYFMSIGINYIVEVF